MLKQFKEGENNSKSQFIVTDIKTSNNIISLTTLLELYKWDLYKSQ
jgi:hypothetical protein